MSKRNIRRVVLTASVIAGLVRAGHAQEETFCQSQQDLANQYLGSIPSVGLSMVTLKLGEPPCFMRRGEIKKNSGVAPDANTVFELASVTKVFTTAILAMHQRQQALYVWGPVQPYLPPNYKLLSDESTVTFQQLATFTGGFYWSDPPGFTKGTSFSQKDFETAVNNLIPPKKDNAIPGTIDLPTYYNYSNGSVGFLGQILMHMDSSKGTSYSFDPTGFSNWISAFVTGPLGMNNTAVEPKGVWATGYNAAGASQDPFLWEPWGAAGALRSTTNDMLKFLKANICAHHTTDPNCSSIPLNILQALETAHEANQYNPAGSLADPTIYVNQANGVEQAWAWQYHAPPVPNPNNVTPILSKNGGHAGFSSVIAFNPDKSYGLVILVNQHVKGLTAAGIQIIRHTK